MLSRVHASVGPAIGGILALALILGSPAGAQAPAPAPASQPPQPTFRTGVSLVRVDVTVTGRDEKAVSDLTAEDFEIYEDDTRQAIEAFQFVRLDGLPTPGDDTSLTIRSRTHGQAEAAREDVRLLAIFLDDYHITREPWVTIPLREGLSRWIARAIRPTDVLVMMDPLTPLSALEFTRSLDDVQRRVKTFEGRRGYYTPPKSVLEEAQLSSRNPRRVRAEVTLSALAALVTHLGSLRERRSSVLFVSEGPPVWFSDGDLEFRMQEILSAANRSNVTIHTLDPRGLRSQSPSDVLWRLSGETGGRAIVNTNSFDRGLDQVVDDASAYYLLGFTPTRATQDGKFHEIQVKVTRKGVRVLSRKGYWAPSEAELATATVTEAPAEVTTALRSLSALDGRRVVTTWTGVERDAAGQPTVSVAWTPTRGRDPGSPAATTLRLIARAGDDHVVTDQRIALDKQPGTGGEPAGVASFTAPTGALVLALTVEDADGAALDRWTEQLMLPATEPGAATLGTPRLFLARSVGEWRALRAGLVGAIATPRRQFRRTDRVLVSVSAQGLGDEGSQPAAADLLNKAGSKLVSLAVTAAGPSTLQLELPLASLATGDYVLKFSKTVGDRSVEEHVAFRLVP